MKRLLCIAWILLVSSFSSARAQTLQSHEGSVSCGTSGTASSEPIPPCARRKPPASDRVPDVASLKTPESPAFMALGATPSDIQRPTTPTGLKASLANGFAAGGALPLLQSFALEFSPYWLFPHDRVSFERLGHEPARALYRNLALSLATSPKDEKIKRADGTSDTIAYGRFSAGIRATLLPGHLSKGAQSCVAYLKDSLEQASLQRNQAIHEFITSWAKKNPGPPTSRPAAKPDIDDPRAAEFVAHNEPNPEFLTWEQQRKTEMAVFIAKYERDHQKILDARGERCLSDIHAHAGFLAEVASAYSVAVPDGKLQGFQRNGLQTTTFWFTAGYIFEDAVRAGNEVSLLFVERLQLDDGTVSDSSLNVWRNDSGARIAMAFERYGLAFEGTYRRQSSSVEGKDKTANLYRTGVSVEYRLSDGIWLSATFGKDFGFKESDKPLLALTNLQWNFGLDRGVKPDTKVPQ